MEIAACYPGSFDPVTYGHLDLMRRATALFDRVVVAVGKNVTKQPLFSAEERAALIQAEVDRFERPVEVACFQGLVVDFCRENGLSVIVRGLRTVSDFESEFQMGLTNRTFAPEIETVFVMPGEKFSYVSSRLIKEVVAVGGSVDAFVPSGVVRALRSRLKDDERNDS